MVDCIESYANLMAVYINMGAYEKALPLVEPRINMSKRLAELDIDSVNKYKGSCSIASDIFEKLGMKVEEDKMWEEQEELLKKLGN
jgi:hypothetical protein